jgi:hypothetical protein
MSTRNNKKEYVKPILNTPVEEVKIITDEEAREHFINEVGETPEKITENLENYHNVDAEAEISKLLEEEMTPKEVKFEFQDEYHFGPGNGDAVIDTLPEEPKCACADPNCECKDDEKCDEKCDKDCTCDLTLPAEEPYIPLMVTEAPKKKTLEQMTACEINIFHKTGIMPLL